MESEYKLVRCEPDDPRRCKAKAGTPDGQCPFTSVEGATKCARHAGVQEANRNETNKANSYRIKIWQNRINEFSESEQSKSLRGEIGILRMLLEETMNKCSDSNDLMMYSTKISDLAGKIEKIVVSCERLERVTGTMLDKAAALAMASQIVAALAEEITDPDVIDKVSNRLIDIIRNTTGQVQ